MMKICLGIFAVLAALGIMGACSDESDPGINSKTDDSTDVVIIRLELHESDPVNFFIPVSINLEGKLTLTGMSGRVIDYSILPGDNTIEVPYGTYQGKVHGFTGFNYDTINLISPTAGRSNIYVVKIANTPAFKWEILTHEVDRTWYYLVAKCDTNFGYYHFIIWGCNDDTTSRETIKEIVHYNRAIEEDGTVKLLIADLNLQDTLFNFYNMSVQPMYGIMEHTLYTHWYALTQK
jgi:hypothetical protein